MTVCSWGKSHEPIEGHHCALHRPKWTEEAACRDIDPAAWHPESDYAALITAQAVCATCPVRQQCRGDAYAAAEGGVPLRVRFGLPGSMRPNN